MEDKDKIIKKWWNYTKNVYKDKNKIDTLKLK